MNSEWKMVRLGDEFKLQMGKTPDRKNDTYWNTGENLWVSIADMSNCSSKHIATTKETISNNATINMKPVSKGTVIMSFKLSIGKVCIADVDLYTNEAIMAFLPRREYYVDFLYYRLLSFAWTEGLNKAVKGITLNKASISNTKMPFPSLERQKQIAFTLDKASHLISLRKKQLEELDALAESVFYDMFGDPVKNEKGWEITSLSEIGSFKNGLNYKQSETGCSMKILGITDFQQRKEISDMSGLNVIQIDNTINAEYCLKNEDIVFVRSNGSRELVGRNLIVYPNKEKVSFSGFCIRFRLESKLILAKFLNEVLFNPTMKNSLFNQGRGCNINNVNQKMLANIRIILPPLSLQTRFATIIEKIESQKALAKKALRESEDLFQRLMQDLFNPN